MNTPAYTVIIPTCGDREGLLGGTLSGLLAQTTPPERIIVVDSSASGSAEAVCRRTGSTSVLHLVAERAGAALQRNQGAAMVETPALVFCDDDMGVPPRTVSMLVSSLGNGHEGPAGVAARIIGMEHAPPGRLLRTYYRRQAGYDHPHFGGLLFGPAINCWPCYKLQTGELLPSQWLNSALVAYRTDAFMTERFPDFDGYSYMEDVHLSARIGQKHPLAFHARALCEHLGATSTATRMPRHELVAMQWRNRIRVAHEVQKTPPVLLRRQLQEHRAFVMLYLARARPASWREEWSALRALQF